MNSAIRVLPVLLCLHLVSCSTLFEGASQPGGGRERDLCHLDPPGYFDVGAGFGVFTDDPFQDSGGSGTLISLKAYPSGRWFSTKLGKGAALTQAMTADIAAQALKGDQATPHKADGDQAIAYAELVLKDVQDAFDELEKKIETETEAKADAAAKKSAADAAANVAATAMTAQTDATAAAEPLVEAAETAQAAADANSSSAGLKTEAEVAVKAAKEALADVKDKTTKATTAATASEDADDDDAKAEQVVAEATKALKKALTAVGDVNPGTPWDPAKITADQVRETIKLKLQSARQVASISNRASLLNTPTIKILDLVAETAMATWLEAVWGVRDNKPVTKESLGQVTIGTTTKFQAAIDLVTPKPAKATSADIKSILLQAQKTSEAMNQQEWFIVSDRNRWFHRLSFFYGHSIDAFGGSVDQDLNVIGVGYDIAPQFALQIGYAFTQDDDDASSGMYFGTSLNLSTFTGLFTGDN